jgi:hypothetical protein
MSRSTLSMVCVFVMCRSATAFIVSNTDFHLNRISNCRIRGMCRNHNALVCANKQTPRMCHRDESTPQKQNNDKEEEFQFYSRSMILPKNFLLLRDDSWKKMSQIYVLLFNPGSPSEGICESRAAKIHQLSMQIMRRYTRTFE